MCFIDLVFVNHLHHGCRKESNTDHDKPPVVARVVAVATAGATGATVYIDSSNSLYSTWNFKISEQLMSLSV